MDAPLTIRPHKGPQEMFLSCSADICIYGGEAGGGKTYGMLLEPLRHIDNPGFGAVYFRRTMPNITNEGAALDTSRKIYPLFGARLRYHPKPMWIFPSGMRVTLTQLINDDACQDFHSTQIPLLLFDELTEFTRYQFFYMLSRNRSTCGVDPYVRAGTNAMADTWVAEFISWWWDPKTGYPIPERAGVIRYMARDQSSDKILWGDTREEAAKLAGIDPSEVKSVTFVPAHLDDNPTLLKENPRYKANLMALPYVERERLMRGNWKIRKAAGNVFPPGKVTILKERPTDVIAWVSRWDISSTEPTEKNPDPDWLVRVLMGRRANGRYFVASSKRWRLNAAGVESTIKSISAADRAYTRGARWKIIIPQEPGAAGKIVYDRYVKLLAGFPVGEERETKDKLTRADPFSAQWQAGNVDLLEGDWNEEYLYEHESFPSESGGHDDQVDASAGAFNALMQLNMPAPPPKEDQTSSVSYWLNR